MACPPVVREKLGELREAFLHAPRFQDGLGAWWASLTLQDRRLFLAFVGLDDSEPAARRPWRQHPQEHRDRIVGECKRLGRLVESLKWA